MNSPAWAGELREWLSPHFRAHLLNDDDLDIAVFAYDRSSQSLRQVLAFPGAAQSAAVIPLDVPLGEGVVGAAFKRSEFVIYIDPALTGSTDDAAYLYDQSTQAEGSRPKWKFVAAFPVFALEDGIQSLDGVSFDDWDPQSTVGVLTISSTATDSGLLSLTDDELQTPGGPANVPHGGPGSTRHSWVQSRGKGAEAVTSSTSSEPRDAEDASTESDPEKPTAVQVWGFAHVMLEYFDKTRVNTDIDKPL